MKEQGDAVSESEADADANVRANCYCIALTVGTCGRCRAPTRLIALVLPAGHHIRSPDEGAGDDEEPHRDSWERASRAALLFFVGTLPSSVRQRMCSMAPAYRKTAGAQCTDGYWANHCASCGSQFDDQDLFCEPDGAFLPTNPAVAAAIDLMRIDEPIEAAAGGYAFEPPLLSDMRDI